MRKTSRTQAQRSAETREKILEATIAVLFEQGNARLTTALVDERAGVSSGARVHHYRSKTDLLVEATRHTYDLAAELGRKRAAEARRSANPLKEYVKDCLSVYFDWPFITALEVVITARTDEALMQRLQPVLDRFHHTMRTTWVEALVEAGYDRAMANEDLAMTLNLVRGMAVNRIWHPHDAELRALLDKWCDERVARAKLDGGRKKRSNPE
jgi:AcrR family transcriptional regulator